MTHSSETIMTQTRWIVAAPSSEQCHRLFCFPYAGGGASVFRLWQSHMPGYIQICAIQPPGRENRIAETPYSNLPELVNALVREVRPFLGRPFSFFGHSTGALVAFELVRALRHNRLPLPQLLMVSGSRPPHIPEPRPIHHLPEPDFINGLRRLAGTPEELLQNREIMSLYTPILRADLALEETYVHKPGRLLEIPLAAMGGDRDLEISKGVLEEWAHHTSGKYTLKYFPGDHFYLRQRLPELIAHIANLISKTIPAEPGPDNRPSKGVSCIKSQY